MRKLLLHAAVLLFTLTITVSTKAQADGGPLSINCPPDLVLLTCSNSAVGHFEVTASGNDGPVVCTPPSGSEFALGVTDVTCIATDNNGGGANCSFSITVKQPSSRWPCPAQELGLGIPYETVGGAISVLRPSSGPGSSGISIFPNAADPESGIVLHPGTAQVISFTTVLDFTAPVGSGFDIVLPPDPLHPNDPPILSFSRKSGPKGYCVKTQKRGADDPTTTSRVIVVNSNGAVLPPLEFTTAEIEANGVFDIGFIPGVTNCHVTIELNCQDGSVSVEFPGPITQSSSRKGWDGCIYGPDRPVKKPTSRVMLIPPVIPGLPPITEARVRVSGWTEMPIEEPSTTSMGRKWGDGHVTLMKAYDDGEGMEFVSLAPGGGVHTELGDSTSFEMRFSHFDDPSGLSSPEQTFSIRGGRWPIGLTNRPPPPPINVRLTSGSTGVDCSADYTALGFSNITVQVWFNGMVIRERTGLAGHLGNPFASISGWPSVLGCPSVGMVRLRNDGAPFVVFWPDEGSINFGDEVRIIPELPPGEVLPASFSQVECVANDGLQGLLYDLQVTPATPLDPLGIVCSSNILTSATSPAGATVNYVPFLHVGECAAFPYPKVVCTPETGSVFPVGTTTVNCSVTNGCGELAVCSFSVTVDQRPVILSQPKNVVVTVGQSAQLNAEAYSGPTAFYQWQIFCPPTRPDFPFCGCLPTQTWRPLCLGCPPPFVDFASVTAECGSGYYLVVSNDFGMVTSAVATITVVPTLQCRDLVFLTCSNSAVGNYQVGVNGQQGPVACSPPSGSSFPLGITSVTCVATNYSGGTAECSFSVTVTSTPSSWACAQVGMGIPFQPVGGATVSVRPEISNRAPAIVITPNPGSTQSGVLLSPGPAQAVTFTILLDFTAAAGSGFDLVLPFNPLHPNDPPILSLHRKSGPKGYCVKTAKIYDDEPAGQFRAFVVNTNGDLLDPLTFTSSEIQAEGVFDINFQPGVSNSYVTVQVDLLDGTISVEYPGPTTPSALRKGWDGCIYGNGTPSKGTNSPKSRVIVKPYSPTYPPPPPITALSVYASGWPTATVEDPTVTARERKWGDGHVTLMKAYDDDSVEFRSFAPNGGVHVDLGHSESFQVRLTNFFLTGEIPNEPQLLTRTIGPIRGLTNRPPPPFLDALLLKGPTNAVDCSADFNNLDSPTVRVVLLSNHVVVAQRTAQVGQLDHTLFTLPSWPQTLSKLSGATPCRRGTIKIGTVRLPGGSGFAFGPDDVLVVADEFRVLAELAPGAPHPDFYSGLEFIANEGPTWRVSNLECISIATPEPIVLTRAPDAVTFSWQSEGFKLQGATTAEGPWFDLGIPSPARFTPTFRCRLMKLITD